ncbi:hypothetical protein N7474_004823 [Penicillium riverlandense]|uniref:uncharacterized protein n=1 Tax=Penicillium riverlandense TaxID=1903569 RepID=UPI00254831B3|nr:uncharacterized protein N7474_004823 [Penicillium riverlandense]KAJ5819232.1 hypothetical protein N7474_004823 [Penicillium riverlandense]
MAMTLPPGSKLWLLNLGYLDVDASALITGANVWAPHLPPQKHDRRELVMIAGLIYHPEVGLILFDSGSCEDVIANWKPQLNECTPRVWDKSTHGLAEAIAATGAGTIGDVKAVVLSHLHNDHAGGLEHFIDSDVEIWCHEEELKYAFWACATGIDRNLYVPHYLQPDRFNWKTFNRETFEIWSGITLHHTPGHTPGSITMELMLQESGSVVMTGDLFHVKENWEDGRPQGSLMRDYAAWHRSWDYVKHLVNIKKGRILLGHEQSYFKGFPLSPKYLA